MSRGPLLPGSEDSETVGRIFAQGSHSDLLKVPSYLRLIEEVEAENVAEEEKQKSEEPVGDKHLFDRATGAAGAAGAADEEKEREEEMDLDISKSFTESIAAVTGLIDVQLDTLTNTRCSYSADSADLKSDSAAADAVGSLKREYSSSSSFYSIFNKFRVTKRPSDR